MRKYLALGLALILAGCGRKEALMPTNVEPPPVKGDGVRHDRDSPGKGHKAVAGKLPG